MAKLNKTYPFKIGEDGVIILTEPTNEDWNDFSSSLVSTRGMKVEDNSVAARAKLFNRCCIKIENIEDEQGPITLESINRLPDRRKARMIFEAFELDKGDIVKNF